MDWTSGQGDDLADAVLERGRLDAAGARPGLERAVAAAGRKPVAGRPDQGGDERRCGCCRGPGPPAPACRGRGSRAASGRPRREEPQLVGLEQQRGRRPPRAAWRSRSGRNSGLSSPSKTPTVPLAVPPTSQLPGRVGRQARARLGQFERLQRLAVLARQDDDLAPARTASRSVGQQGQGRRRGGEAPARRRRACRPWRRPGRGGRRCRRPRGRRRRRRAPAPPAGSGVGGERQLLGVEPVEGGRLALGVDGDEGQRAADADDRLDVAAVGQVFLDRCVMRNGSMPVAMVLNRSRSEVAANQNGEESSESGCTMVQICAQWFQFGVRVTDPRHRHQAGGPLALAARGHELLQQRQHPRGERRRPPGPGRASPRPAPASPCAPAAA